MIVTHIYVQFVIIYDYFVKIRRFSQHRGFFEKMQVGICQNSKSVLRLQNVYNISYVYVYIQDMLFVKIITIE